MTDNKYTSFAVGDKVCSPSKDEVIFEMTDGGGLLLIKLNSPTSDEKKAIKNGVAQFKFAEINGIIFFLSRFGTMNWMDAPFHRQFSSMSEFARPNENEGLLLHIMLIDARTGIMAAQRVVGLQHNFTNALLDTIAAQPSINVFFDVVLSEIYNKYTTYDMLKMAIAEN